ncbi:2-oxo acid dehydrogenase subunit E2 [Natrialbaceae archaeon AArc-T1-2]|uniref:2-oxo acid dehydrogenase subunit E2 n=1 Tax=Natrialbaceae archaeon AArc-T1-2 TaxID=3053904 RepID=UPI00255AFC98|nr:2-oxo acid dehydrogenase subunit E2 [Natrialbaceae archaeon AArc-T1-2]WIV68084.1 2-oxo acid dehydrogenase subunit E2 [Natrialbaceae archaeon AArc-T1-2]
MRDGVEIPDLETGSDRVRLPAWFVDEGEPVATGERSGAVESGEATVGLEAMTDGGDEPVDDVETEAEEDEENDDTPEGILEERPLDGMRRTISDRLGRSYREAVHVTERRIADAEELRAAATAAAFVHEESVTVTDVLLAALSATFEEHPSFNATFEGGVHRLHESHHIAVAVDVEDGLLTPVVRDVDERSIGDLACERARMTDRARSGEYTMTDLTGATFTVTNLGPLGVESFDPVINPPQVAILGVDALRERPVARDGELTVRRTLPVDLSFDHRVVDGADAARFLETLVGHLEEPWPLLPDVTAADVPADVDWRGDGAGAVELPERDVTASLEPDLSGAVDAGSERWPFDVTEDFGGGSAPTPVDYFLGALSACLASSIGIQADIRDVDLATLEVRAVGSPADDSESVESIALDVTIDADADDDVLERIVEAGERTCHVAELLRADLETDLGWSRA